MKSLLLSGILLVWLFSACTPAAPTQTSVQNTPVSGLVPVSSLQDTPTSAATPTVLVFPTPVPEEASATPAAVPTTDPQATLPAAPTFTSDFVETPRPPAEKWQQWPVIPSITAHALEIYRQGLAMGTDPHAFAKVGDCQFVPAAFFGIYDQPGAYAFPKGYEYLQETIDWFSGYFGRQSAAVRGGFNVASVFVPLQADPAICRAGETPLACEFRSVHPSIVMISMETGFEGRTAAVYEKYMRQIIEYAIAQGALPILATKADDFEGDNSINLTTARLALEYDLPLWNFWRAVQPLPDHGMDAERNDKFHISVEAWNVRSFTGLQTLDAIWRTVREQP